MYGWRAIHFGGRFIRPLPHLLRSAPQCRPSPGTCLSSGRAAAARSQSDRGSRRCGRLTAKRCALAYWDDGTGKPGIHIDFDQRTANGCGPERRHEAARWNFRQEALQRLGLLHADDRIVVAGHAGIGHVSGSLCKNPRICRGYMGMGSDDGCHSAIEIHRDGLFFGRCLGVKIYENRIGCLFQRAGADFLFNGWKRIVERLHEDTAHSINHEHVRSVAGAEYAGASSWRAGRIVQWPKKPVLAADKDQGLALVPNMISCCDHVGARVGKLDKNLLCDPEAAGGVFAIDNDEVGAKALTQRWQPLAYGTSARSPHDIANEKNPHP